MTSNLKPFIFELKIVLQFIACEAQIAYFALLKKCQRCDVDKYFEVS